jgi:hypothetical protein
MIERHVPKAGGTGSRSANLSRASAWLATFTATRSVLYATLGTTEGGCLLLRYYWRLGSSDAVERRAEGVEGRILVEGAAGYVHDSAGVCADCRRWRPVPVPYRPGRPAAVSRSAHPHAHAHIPWDVDPYPARQVANRINAVPSLTASRSSTKCANSQVPNATCQEPKCHDRTGVPRTRHREDRTETTTIHPAGERESGRERMPTHRAAGCRTGSCSYS